MGNKLSKDNCVSIAHLPLLMDSTYTVIRTSGKQEDGWTISGDHKCLIYGNVPPWVVAHACKKDSGEWCIFMHNNQTDTNLHACGWRRLNTIMPTHLLNDKDAITTWRSSISMILDELQNAET